MTKLLIIYSPAPATTRLHALNEAFGQLLAKGGIANKVIAVALPDAINQIANLPPDERMLHLPIITPIDLLPAINKNGVEWHAYNRRNSDLKFVASLYDVAFGLTAFSANIKIPDDLRGKRIAVPPRPSSVRIYSEALLFDAWGLEGDVELIDMPPPKVLDAVKAGDIDATTWNITTLEGTETIAALPWVANHADAHWIAVDDEVARRINQQNDFIVETMMLGDVQLLSFRQGLAVWQETPDEIIRQIIDILTASKGGQLYHQMSDLRHWPEIDGKLLHPVS